MKKRTAASRCYLLYAVLLESSIVMQIAGDKRLHFHTTIFEETIQLENTALLFLVFIRHALVLDVFFPVRLRHAEDDLVAPIHLSNYRFEILKLADIDVVTQLKIDSEEPPLLGQLECEITSSLSSSPSAI